MLSFACFTLLSCTSSVEDAAATLYDANWDLDGDGDSGDRSGEYNNRSAISFGSGGDKPVYMKGYTYRNCDGYKGFRTPSGIYKGECQNTDGWGHRCGASPEKHGLN